MGNGDETNSTNRTTSTTTTDVNGDETNTTHPITSTTTTDVNGDETTVGGGFVTRVAEIVTTTVEEEESGIGGIVGAAGGAVAGVGAIVAGLMAKGVIPGFKSKPSINLDDADIDVEQVGVEREIFADIDESMFHV